MEHFVLKYFSFLNRAERGIRKKMIEIIDVGKENFDQNRKEEISNDADKILCNSMKMMREKLTISEGIVWFVNGRDCN